MVSSSSVGASVPLSSGKRLGLSRENVMEQAANMRLSSWRPFVPSVKINTSATDFAPISQVQLMRFKGETWERFGEIIDAGAGG
jgi:branched-chain amino acid transport system substrate-binding protein